MDPGSPGHEVPTESEGGLRREISRLGFAAISLNGVIGAGIFALPAVAASAAGLFSPWLFVVCSVLIMTVVLSFARAASFFSHTGGPIAYVGHAFGPFAGFQVGWLYTLSRVSAFAANVNLLLTYGAWFWKPLDEGLTQKIAMTFITVFLVYINIIGLRRGLQAIFVFTALKLIPLVLIVILGISHINPQIFVSADLPVIDDFGHTILVLLYAFVGFEGAVVPAGEARNPQRDIPRALVLSVLAITGLYVLIQSVAVSVVPAIGSSEAPLIEVAQLLMGWPGAALVAAGAVFSITGNTSSMLFSAPRTVFAMSRQGMLPPWFGVVHERWGTPANSILFLGALVLILALSGSFIWLAAMSTVVRLLVYASCILSLPRMHTALADGQKPFHLPGGYLIPLVALVLCGWLVTFASMRSWVTAGGFAALGAVLYWVSYGRKA